MTTRRDRNRAATVAEIKKAALDLIAAEGAAALGMRSVARKIGMSPAGLYRYYDGLDDLITELVTDAYTDLAVAVENATAAPGTAAERFTEGALAYRRWAVDHPNRFLLIFGTPIPGYSAPEGGPTVEANRRVGEAFFRVAAEGWAHGEMRAPGLSRPTVEGERELGTAIATTAPGFPDEMVPALLGTWAHFHGIVTLEVLHQLHWMYPDPGIFYRGEVDRMLSELTVEP